jgi:hypothetical protein
VGGSGDADVLATLGRRREIRKHARRVSLVKGENAIDEIAASGLRGLHEALDRLRIEEGAFLLCFRRVLPRLGNFDQLIGFPFARLKERADTFGEFFDRERLVQNRIHADVAPRIGTGACDMRRERDDRRELVRKTMHFDGVEEIGRPEGAANRMMPANQRLAYVQPGATGRRPSTG